MNKARPLVLTTGGAGYVGSHTIVDLINSGYDTVIVDNFVNSSEYCVPRLEKICERKIICRNLDLLNKDGLSALFCEFSFDFVIHFAALKSVGDSVSCPLKYYENNVTGIINLLQVMLSKNVKRLVYSSSCTVYGDPASLPLDETHSIGNCTSPYGSTKYIGELILKDLAYSDPEWCIMNLRYFNPVGAHPSGLIGEDVDDIPKNIFPYICKVAYGLLPEVSIFGDDYNTRDGTGVRDYVHVMDIARGHVAAIEQMHKFKGFKAYNLGTGSGYSVLELIFAMEAASGKTIPYKIAPRRPGDTGMVFADTTLAATELGWRSQFDLANMCADAWRWQIMNPNGYSIADG